MSLSPTHPTQTLTSPAKGTASARPRAGWWSSLFILCAILGAMLGLSVKTQNAARRDAEGKGYQFLATQVLAQQATIAALNKNILKLEGVAGQGDHPAPVLDADLKQAKFLAGLTDVQGPGLIVTLNDSKHTMPSDLPSAIMPNIIHDNDINQAVNELKAAGAEAVSINSQRLVGTTPIRCAGPTVFINNVPQTPPYVIKAIGEPSTLQTALNLQNGVADQLRRTDPSMIKMQKVARLVIPAYAGATTPRYAKPVSVQTASAQKG